MTVTTKSEDGRIECFHNSILDKETFALTLPSGKYGFITIRINIFSLDALIFTLQKFREVVKIATGR